MMNSRIVNAIRKFEKTVDVSILLLNALGCDTSLYKILFYPEELKRVKQFIDDMKGATHDES